MPVLLKACVALRTFSTAIDTRAVHFLRAPHHFSASLPPFQRGYGWRERTRVDFFTFLRIFGSGFGLRDCWCWAFNMILSFKNKDKLENLTDGVHDHCRLAPWIPSTATSNSLPSDWYVSPVAVVPSRMGSAGSSYEIVVTR